MESEGSQEPTIYPYPEQHESSHSFLHFYLLILSFHPYLNLPSDLFLSGFLIKVLHALLITLMLTTCPANLTLLDIIILIILDEK
jgi:hypothetical protein